MMDKKTKAIVNALRHLADETERRGIKRGTIAEIKIAFGIKDLPFRSGDTAIRRVPTGGRIIHGEWMLGKEKK